jgi:hypothetical protein
MFWHNNGTILTMSTCPLNQDQLNFVWTSKFFSFYLELPVYKNKFKNLVRTSNFKFLFRGLMAYTKNKGWKSKYALWYFNQTYMYKKIQVKFEFAFRSSDYTFSESRILNFNFNRFWRYIDWSTHIQHFTKCNVG